MDSSSDALPIAAQETIKHYNMCGQGDRVAVGVSGGADSVALLAFLYSLHNELPLELVVCHVNHRLRGTESDGDEQFVRELAAQLGLAFEICSFDAAGEAAAAGVGVEEYSRQRRYSFFARCAGEGGKIATAHTLSDAVETVIFNLLRGTGVKGMCGIPRSRENIIRPLRDCTREQVESYLNGIGQSYRTDSTNNSDDYSRNFIRHNIIPAMQTLNPSLHTAVGRTMEQMEQQWCMTAQLADTASRSISNGEYCFRRSDFLQLPLPVGSLLLQRWLAEVGAVQSEKQLSLMRHYAELGSGATQIAGGVRFTSDRDYIRLIKEQESSPPFSVKLSLPNPGASTEFTVGQSKTLKITGISVANDEITEKFYNIDLKNLVSCDKIKEHVFAHSPNRSDTINLQGRSHSLFTRYRAGSRGFTAGEISAMTVVEDEDGVIWAERLGCDQLRMTDKRAAVYYSFEVL